MIRLSDILTESSIRLDVTGADKESVIRTLVDVLVDEDVVVDPDRMMTDILNRERVMSTGIGGGIAVPHAQSPGASRLALALGRMSRPLEFDSLDERPVNLLFLVVGPEEKGGFIRVLARIGRLLYSGDLQRNLLRARTPAEVLECIRFEESRITG